MEEALIKRVMPHSVEAEQSVVGAMLMDKDAITTASEIISGQDFYQTSYGVVFDSMVELFNEGKPVDLVTLQERLKEKDVPPEISSLEFVRDLVNAVPTSANVKYYAEIVADKAMMRRLIKLNEEIENAVKAIKKETEELGYRVTGMAASGVSAGGTLAMNLAYGGNSAIPVRFVFELAAPTYFVAEDWGSLMKSDNLGSEEEFYRMMTGKELSAQEYRQEIKKISPTCLVGEDSVPTLIGYGLKDHCVPADQKEYLIDALEKNGVSYDYVEFPHSNHLLYGDLDKMQTFMDLSLEYCKKYFQ